MPEFLPFLGTRYNASRVLIENVTSPPYDVISEDFRNLLYARDPHNVIRLEWSRDADPYTSAKQYFDAWKREGILKREERPAFFVYRQVFKTPNGEEIMRTGVIGRLKLSAYGKKEVLPHERTHAWPKKDRLELMEHTHTNFSPIFGLVSDASFLFDQSLETATVNAPLADVKEMLPSGETVRHLLWRMDNDDSIQRISKIVAPTQVIIADGHHRYETAVEFMQKHPEISGGDYMMMFLANLQSDGAVILPTHRLLHGVSNFNPYALLDTLRERFQLVFFTSREEGFGELERDDNALTLIELPEDPKWVLLRSDENSPSFSRRGLGGGSPIPAARIEEEIFVPIVGLSRKAIDERANLLYPHTFREVDEMEDEVEWNAAFLLRAIRPNELQSVVERGEFMPQKSTYFFPKLLTGLVFHEFEAQG
ncbi:MAG TPA: DUF1015 domain-containing protein [Candidatus Kapabacteria bacterium]|jgi:uncharacterized protein (DUF1015 family)